MKSTNSTVGMGKIPPQCGGNVAKATKGDGSRGSAPAVKKALSLFLSLAMLFSITAGLDFSAYANIYSGKCGKNATWTLNTATKTLIISGTGAMYDYAIYEETPPYRAYEPTDLWQYYVAVENLIVEEGLHQLVTVHLWLIHLRIFHFQIL